MMRLIPLLSVLALLPPALVGLPPAARGAGPDTAVPGGAISLVAYGTAGHPPCTGQDDAAAFTAAIAAASARGGGTVAVPDGSCLVSAPINLPAKVRLVGLGPASQIAPAAPMAAVILVTGGQSSVENVTLQQSGTLAATGVTIAKGDQNPLPVDLVQLTVIGFPRAMRLVSGDAVRVFGGFYLNNGVAFAYEPASSATVNDTIAGGTLVQGGRGVDLPANISGTIYPHVEGLLISDLQVIQGIDDGFCLRMGAGVHIVWRGGMCAEARRGGYGFRLEASRDTIRSVEIADVFIGANPGAAGTLGGVSITAAATGVKLHDLHFSSWRATPIAIDPGQGTALVSIARVSFDGTKAAHDISAAHAAVTVLQPQYDVPSGVLQGPGGTVISWPP